MVYPYNMVRLMSIVKGTCNILFKLVQVGCVAHVVTTYGVDYVVCADKSMEPEIYNGDCYLVESVSVYRHKLKSGDIVGFKSPEEPDKYICKRIVGMEGEKVYDTDSQERILVPRGHVWVEGDNKVVSKDSRKYGPIPYGLIFCKLKYKIISANKTANTVHTKIDS